MNLVILVDNMIAPLIDLKEKPVSERLEGDFTTLVLQIVFTFL